MNEQEQEKLKKIELDLLILFKDVCEKENLHYFLTGGTLLGAVRHKGFIPWDDDIDVAMPRKDFDRFVEIAKNYLPGEIFLQTRDTDPEVPYNYAKLRDSKTTFIESSVKNLYINHGVFIDVFPMDFFPESKIHMQLTILMLSLIKIRIRPLYTIDEKSKHNRIVETGLKMISMALSLVYPSYKSAIDAQDKMARSVKHSSLIGNYFGAWGIREIVPANWFDDSVDIEFEGIKFKAPIGWDEYLTHIYGNYMELPPIEKRVGHHYTEIIDFNKPYSYYTESIHKKGEQKKKYNESIR